MNNNFIGPFKDVAPLYIEYKKSLGYISETENGELKRLDKYFYNKNIKEIKLTKEMVEEYGAKKINESPDTQRKRLSLLKQFAVYLKKLGYKDIYIHNIKIKKSDSEFRPYIYTKSEISLIFDYIDKHQYDNNSKFNCVLPIFIRLLLGCGFRKGELLNLKNKDVDLENQLITIHNGKGNVTRIVPISNSLKEACKTYKTKFKNNKEYFLCNINGEKLSEHITEYFQSILKKLNILRPDKTPPRLHDFRFTFSVYALEKMIDNNVDLYTTLPILSKYLGHKNITATEHYLLLASDYFIKFREKEELYYENLLILGDDIKNNE